MLHPCLGKEVDKKKICTCKNKHWEDKEETIKNDHLRWGEMRNKMETCHLDLILDSLPTTSNISFKSQWLKERVKQNK